MSYTPEKNKPCKGFCSKCTLFDACSQLRRSKPPEEYYKYKVNYNNLFG